MSQIKILIWVLCVIVAAALGSSAFYFWFWQPRELRQKAMELPLVPQGLNTFDLGLDQTCTDLPPDTRPSELAAVVHRIRDVLSRHPNDLCAGNSYRRAIRYLNLRKGYFVITIGSLPTDLAAIVGAQEANPARFQESSSEPSPAVSPSPSSMEPASLFYHLASDPRTDGPETRLQLGLSYVDLMIHEGGRESKAQLSSRSIDALNVALRDRPYLVGALYAHGLNYLYWPSIAGRLPISIRDFKTCIALSRLAPWRDHPQRIFAEAYVAIGDAYAKSTETVIREQQKRDLLNIARAWWREGLDRYPGYGPLETRLGVEPRDLPTYVESTRGLETYINTDLNLMWTY